MKKWISLLILLSGICFIKEVDAGTLSWNNSKRLSPNSFEIYLETNDLDLNYVSGTWEVTNGRITDIVMHDGWINTSGINNTFYYYHDGIKTGDYRIATITIELNGDSTTKMNNVDIGVYQCSKDSLNHFFSNTGTLVTEAEYNQVCFSNDATLKGLNMSNGTLSPAFRKDILYYSATVENAITEVVFSPIVNDSHAHIVSGTSCNLNVGDNTCNIVVEAENGDKKIYTVLVTRKEAYIPPTINGDATLKGLSVSSGVLYPSFDSNVENYTMQVNSSVDLVTFYPILNATTSKIVSNVTCSLQVGENLCKIIVEAEDGTQKSYNVTVIREENASSIPSSDASLKNLSMSSGELSPSFQSDIEVYSSLVGYEVDKVIFAPILNDTRAQIVSGLTCSLSEGFNVCNIVVEAENGNQKTYTIHVTREQKPSSENAENDTSIRDLTVQNGTLTPEFDRNQKEYTIEVDETTETIVFQYTMNANDHNFSIPYQIQPSESYYDLVITSLNQQKQDVYRFYIKIKNSSNLDSDNNLTIPGEDIGNSNPSDPGMIKNPQTGDSLSISVMFGIFGFGILGILCMGKKNVIRKL